MRDPNPADIAAPSVKQQLMSVISYRCEEIVLKIGRKYAYEVLCPATIHAITAEVKEELRQLCINYSLYGQMSCDPIANDSGSTILRIAYDGKTITNLYLT